MPESAGTPAEILPLRVEPGLRLVVLARTVQVRDPGWEAAWAGGATGGIGPEAGCLGRALYRHRSVFRGASDAPAWSHLELHYFRDIVPVEAVDRLVFRPEPAGARLLRAEILLATPSAFVVPRGWRGTADRSGRLASLEYIDVRPDRLGEYRDIMRRHIGPAAARLVAADRVGTFRAMETAAVLHRDTSFGVGWNRIHLCEVEPDGFEGFGTAFDAALRELAPAGGFEGVFANLGDMRTIPRWTFNDPVVEADLALGLIPDGSPAPLTASDPPRRGPSLHAAAAGLFSHSSPHTCTTWPGDTSRYWRSGGR